MSASALEHERAELLSAGCDDFLPEPFREGQLFGVAFVYDGRSGPAANDAEASRAPALTADDSDRSPEESPDPLTRATSRHGSALTAERMRSAARAIAELLSALAQAKWTGRWNSAAAPERVPEDFRQAELKRRFTAA